MKNKKFLCIIFAVLLCLLFCSCNQPDASETTASVYSDTTTSHTFVSEETSTEITVSEDVSSEIPSAQSSKAVSSKKAVVSKAQSSKASSSGTKKQDDKYPYFLSVNRKQNVVTVYKQNEKGEYTVPYKAFVCSCGKNGATPKGTYTTQNKYEWRALVGGVYGQYATRITGQILFHSVPYFKKDKSTLEYEEYNKLGTAASLGCVRLAVADAKWIYDNCAIGTTVKIYDGDEKLPFGKPSAQKIDVKSENRGWDPTDPDTKNPWKKSPVSSAEETSSEAPSAVQSSEESESKEAEE